MPFEGKIVPPDLAEVWGDIVSLRHLTIAVILGGTTSLVAYLAAVRLLALVVPDPAIAKAWAMMVGLAGCLAGGALCARLLPPKRILVDGGADQTDHAAATALLLAEVRTNDQPASPKVVAELKALGLADPLEHLLQETKP
jgi:hypothetical protein